MHLDTVLILVGVKIHLGELARLFQFIDGCKKAQQYWRRYGKCGRTRAVERQNPKGGGVFSALGECTPIEVDIVRRTQDEHALSELQEKVSRSDG